MNVDNIINSIENEEDMTLFTMFQSFIPENLNNNKFTYDLIDVLVNIFKDKQYTLDNLLEIGEKDFKIDIWLEYFVNANIYLEENIDTLPYEVTDMRTFEKFPFENIFLDVIIDNRTQTIDAVYNCISCCVKLLSENGKLLIRNIPSRDWYDKIINNFKNIYIGVTYQYYNLNGIFEVTEHVPNNNYNNNPEANYLIVITRLPTFIEIMSDIKKRLLSGFFSNCIRKLQRLFLLHYKMIEVNVDDVMSVLPTNYIPSGKSGEKLLTYFFKDPSEIEVSFDDIIHTQLGDYNVEYSMNQHADYRTNRYDFLNPVIKKYFTPSDNINKIIETQTNKYNIDLSNTCSVYYRGTDKYIEAAMGDFDTFEKKVNDIKIIDPTIKIFIQTDSADFLDYMKNKFPDIMYFSENITSYLTVGLHYESTPDVNFEQIQLLLASILIMSKCKYVISNTSNGSYWISLYRGNCENFYKWDSNLSKFLCDNVEE